MRPTISTQYGHHTIHQRFPSRRTTNKLFWHHFYEDEEAWPKVVLILSSTETLTTATKNKKTFPNYFPNLYKSLSTENIDTDNQNNSEDDVRHYESAKKDGNAMVSGENMNADEDTDDVSDDVEDHLAGFRADETPAEERSTDFTDSTPLYTPERTTAEKTESTYTIERYQEATGELTDPEDTDPTDATISLDRTETYPKNTKWVAKTDTSHRPTTKAPTTTAKTGLSTPTVKATTTQAKTTKATTTVTKTTTKNTTTTSKPVIARCYQCGLNITDIPNIPSCHHIFDSPDRTFVALRKHYRVICKNAGTRTKEYEYDPSPQKTFKGN